MLIAHVHRLLSLTVLALAGTLAFTGCETTSALTGQDSIRTLTTSANTNWVLVHWISTDGAKQAIHSPAPTLMIGYQGRISGQAGVNNYVGTAGVADGQLDWGAHLAVTRMAGTPALMEGENRYLADLKASRRVTVKGSLLVFTGEKSLRLEFARAKP